VRGLTIINLDIAVAVPPAKRYQSVFRALEYRSEFSSAAALTFDLYSFCTNIFHGRFTERDLVSREIRA